MHLLVTRNTCRATCTIGKLYINGEEACYTLEDVVRPEKIYGQTAIPYGTYKVIISYSPHFKKPLPLLLDVPNFEGVRIHPGNTVEDTEGCLLLGSAVDGDSVTQSRAAFNRVFPQIEAAWHRHEPITMEIRE